MVAEACAGGGGEAATGWEAEDADWEVEEAAWVTALAVVGVA